MPNNNNQTINLSLHNLQIDKVLSSLKEILGKILGVSFVKIDIHSNLLEMGVESLLLIQFSRSIQEKLGVKIPFRQLLEEFPTLNGLAIHIVQQLPASFYQETADVELQRPTAEKVAVKSPNIPLLNQSQNLNNKLSNKPTIQSNFKTASQEQSATIKQLVAEQLKLMEKQLDLLHSNYSRQKKSLSHQVSVDINLSQTTSKPLIASPKSEKAPETGLNPRQQQHLDALIVRFVQRTQESKRLTQASRPYLANPRSITGFRLSIKEMLYPIHAERASGAKIWDVDGNEYIDMSMGFGSLLFGHSPTFVTKAIQEHIQQGIQNGPQSRLTGEVAKLFCELTGQERVTFCNSGTDAVMGAIRIARATTGRSKIAIFNGSYHGTLDEVLVAGVATENGSLRSLAVAPGIPQHIAEKVLVLNYGSSESLNILKANADELAAVLVEPVQSRRPDFQPQEFLRELRQLTQDTGIVLIFDEVITGFRMHPGGIQALWGIQADITTYGKALGSGLPIGVVAGKATFVDALDGGFWSYGDASYPQVETTTFAGTFFKNPLVMAVTWSVLQHIKGSGSTLQAELARKTAKIADVLNSFFEDKQLPIQVIYFGSLFRFVYPSNLVWMNLFFFHLLEKGIYIWEGRTFYVSTAHSDTDIENFILAVKESILELQAGEFLPFNSDLNNQDNQLGDRGDKEKVLESSDRSRSTITVPLTEVQKELWFLAKVGDNASRAYNQSITINLHGKFNFEAVSQAVQTIVNRHEALRTTFSSEGDYQVIHPTLTIDIPVTDFSVVDGQHRIAKLSEFLTQAAQQIFELEKSPLLRVHIVKLEEQHHCLILTFHHIIADGWSIAILLRELAAIYTAKCQNISCQLPQPVKYSEYVQWQASQQQTLEMATAKAYWLQQFSSIVPVLELPTDRTRPSVNTFRGGVETVSLGTSLYNQLKSLSDRSQSTLFTTLLAGYMVLLRRLTGQDDIVVGIASAGQSLVDGNCLVGHCVNLLPIRSQTIGEIGFTEYLSDIKGLLLEAYEHQIYPLIELVKNLSLPRDSSRNPLISTVFNLDKSEFSADGLGQIFEPIKNHSGAAKYDIALNINQTNSDLIVECEYNTDLFDSHTIQRWLEHFRTLLAGIVANPHQKINNLPLLTTSEKHQLLLLGNHHKVNYSQQHCIHELFETQVEHFPDAIAVVFEQQQLTYQELNVRANQLAHYLKSLGVKPEVLVGICVERSLEMVVGILAILKAGGAYVPLDPAYPQERLAYILKDSQISVLLTQERLLENLPPHSAKIVCLDRDEEIFNQQNPNNLTSGVTPNNLAYIIYTSGSTGQPKGVLINHANIVRLFAATQSWYNFNHQDVWTVFHSYGFDFSVWEIWGALIYGAKLIVVPYWVSRSPEAFYNLLSEERVTVLNQTPSAFRQLIELEESLECNQDLSLRLVIFGGEALDIPSLKPWFERHGDKQPQLVNMYGITETTVHVTYRPIAIADLEQTRSAIGEPIPDLQLYLLDRHQQLVPVGVPGEIYVGGAGLARGYLNHPQYTQEKFIINPFAEELGEEANSRLYKSGDLACYLPNGDIQFLGRIDNQVKIRGFRIELGEIEATLNQHPQVREVVVMVQANELDDRGIVAYISSNLEQELTVTQLRNFLQDKLPEYMLPSAFVILENLPLTANGKVDRKSLSKLEIIRPNLEVAYVIPQTEAEQTIASIWQQALNIEKIGIHDNFFELGGHSLLMVKVHSQLREIFKTELSILDLFRYSTISSLAEYFNKVPILGFKVDLTEQQTQKIVVGKSQQKKRLQKMKSIVDFN
jgi:amino acid adenylation domain-containing protein